jgi:hypothetical protein
VVADATIALLRYVQDARTHLVRISSRSDRTLQGCLQN